MYIALHLESFDFLNLLQEKSMGLNFRDKNLIDFKNTFFSRSKWLLKFPVPFPFNDLHPSSISRIPRICLFNASRVNPTPRTFTWRASLKRTVSTYIGALMNLKLRPSGLSAILSKLDMSTMKPSLLGCLVWAALSLTVSSKINRRDVIEKFNPVRHASSNSTPMQVGNGNFAFGIDVTGLQTFLPYATLSSWGWHNFSLPFTPGQTSPDDFTGLNWYSPSWILGLGLS